MTTSGKGERKGKDAHKECRDEYARVLGEQCQTHKDELVRAMPTKTPTKSYSTI